jgi:aquaporin Z
VAGAQLCAFITFEAPFSGMSLNPAHSVASALSAGSWKAIWIYFLIPPLAMLIAARFWLRAWRRFSTTLGTER